MNCVRKVPSISIIMGAYNVTSLAMFDTMIDSVLKQTFSDFEFIICDDGSTDNTNELLKKLAELDSRIKILHNPRNEGLASALNNCITEAQGEFIARQDADDFSVSERFARQTAFLERNPKISFVGSDVVLWDEGGDWGERHFPQYPQAKDFLFAMPFVHGALMFRKEALKNVGGYRVAKETRRAEDYDLLMRMYAQGLRGANLPEKLYYFREDDAATYRRKYRYRIDEAIVRWKNFADLDLMPRAIPYVVKPLIVGLIPQFALRRIKRWQYGTREKKKEKNQ